MEEEKRSGQQTESGRNMEAASGGSVGVKASHSLCLFQWRCESERSRRSQPVSRETKGTARGLIYTTKRHFTVCDLDETFLSLFFVSNFCQVCVAAHAERKYRRSTSDGCHAPSTTYICCVSKNNVLCQKAQSCALN